MVDSCLFRGRTAEYLWLPGVEMTVKMNDTNRAVGSVHAAEERKRDRVVATKGDYSWKSFAMLRDPLFVRIGKRITHQQAVVTFFNLLEGIGIIIATGWCQ